MTDSNYPPPPQSPPGPLIELAYQTPPPWGNAPTLVRLAAILTFVSAGFDVLYAVLSGTLVGFMHYAFTHAAPLPPAAPGGPPAPALPAGAELYMIYAIYGGPGVLCLLVLGFKIYGAVKLLRRGPKAWGWGLAAAIIGCSQLWMCMPCCVAPIIPMGVGIYSIIILCLPHVRQYMRFAVAAPSMAMPPGPGA